MEFDICIVGAGTWGSAVAYHLTSENPNKLRVCLIGPEEPQDRSNATIFGSYFDEGRITKVADQNIIWGHLAKRSLERHREVEQKSGISFYEEVGYLFLGDKYVKKQADLHADLYAPATKLDSQEMNEKFPFLASSTGLYSNTNAGYINIRKQRLAHQKLAKLKGCIIISDVVDDIQECSNHLHLLTTYTGMHIHSKKVLLTTGAFTGFRNLIPGNVVPDMEITTERVILCELSEDVVCRMKSMPSILYKPDDLSNSCYILPPIKYPDGKYYLKVGHGVWGNIPLKTNRAIIQHFRNQEASWITSKLYKIMKNVMAVSNILKHNQVELPKYI
ncbi:monomeric sarcosine oxidase-like isoform X2 [Antedon mediterranea]|uniref:monomeric sarcosine oxidase-like isoform X2 n=1 Tax=Antedon mediterranea TaxID=105859 RepID=UPI003AF48A31